MAAAWQLARLALEDHGEGKFDKGGIFSGVPGKHRPTPSLIPTVHTLYLVSDLLHNIHPFVDFNFTIIIIGSLSRERERDVLNLGKSLFYLLQLSPKFGFPPTTIKPGISPPSTFQTVHFTSLERF